MELEALIDDLTIIVTNTILSRCDHYFLVV